MITPKALAEMATVSLSTIYALLRSGKLPGYRVGVNGKGKWLLKWEDWEAFLATCRVSDWPQEGDDKPYAFL